MPTYEYKCVNGHVFELKQSFSDKPIDKCPECDAKAKRVIHAVSVTFKGSGWYVNDHGRSTRQEPTEKPSASADSASTSKESKPAPTPAPAAKESKDTKSSSSNSSSSSTTSSK
ncbi:MAG: FmdB family transcriptional regulator [Dehalococcoidia bacterium]|nr:FmdB family transcriptional regulator [Dehalococcoidia bacterium]